jgi:RHS repeat-associated protein
VILLADLDTPSSFRRFADGKAVFRKNRKTTYRAATAGVKAKSLVPPEDPYGRTTLVSGTNLSDFQYAGMYMHQPSGLYLTPRGNTYDPTQGRWIGRDSWGEGASLNLYRYVDNNPINEVDPSGHNAIVIGGAIGTAIEPGGGTAIGIGIGVGITVIIGIEIWIHHPSSPPAATSCPMAQTEKPGFTGPPGSTETKPKQTRKYGPDGYPETDVDAPHGHNPDTHAHDWDRPADGSAPTKENRGPDRPLQPGDPPKPPLAP